MDVFDVSIADDGQKTVFPDTRVAPRAEVIEHVASMLHEAAQPMFLIGDDVSWSGAHSELLEVAHRTRASIYGMGLTMAGSLLSDPAFAGFMPVTSGTSVAEITRKADLILAIGASLGTEIMPRTTADYLSAGARLIEVASSPIELGRNLLPEHAIQADPRCFLGLVDRELEKRGATTKPAKLQRVGDTESPTQETLDSGVFTSATMMRMIAAEAPTDAVLVDESMSATEELRTALRGKVGLTYQSCHARGIGSGLPAAVAAKLVFPSRPVISVSADGAALYVLPSLWTAAHLKLDVVFVIYNNRAYRVLKANLLDYWRGLGEGTRSFPFMDLDPPPIRFTQIAEGMGVSGTAATDAESLRSALASALLTRGPHLIEVELPGEADTLA
jgi:benzoylformate decarboxylase